MLQGITLCWARYGQDQLTDLFYVYFLLFLTVGKKSLLEKSVNLPPPPCLFFFQENRLSGIAGSALLIAAATSLPPVSLCSPAIPTLIEKPWKEFPGQKRKGKKKKIWIAVISDLSRPLCNIHLFWAAFDTSFPPTPIRNQLWVASPCSFSPASRCTLQFYSCPEHDSIKWGKGSG